MPLLSVENLKTYFYINNREYKAVDGVSFQVEKGEVEIEENGIQKIQIKENCITIYFTENSHRFCEVSRCCFKCRGCYVFIHRDDSEHADLHKTEAEMELSHFHLKHKKVNSVEEKEFDYFLNSLVHHRVISERQKRAYMSKFLIKNSTQGVYSPNKYIKCNNFIYYHFIYFFQLLQWSVG